MSLTIDPVAFHIPIPFLGWWPIYWYGISWVLAILTIHWVAKEPFLQLQRKTTRKILFYGVLGAIIGGRLGYMCFYGMQQIIQDPFSILKFGRVVYLFMVDF